MDKKPRRRISKEERLKIQQKTNGKCGYCGIELPKRWHVDHIKPFVHGGTCDFENLMASCPSCNNYKMSWGLEEFRRELSEQLGRLNRNSVNYRFAKRFGQIQETPSNITFYFEEQPKEGREDG